MKNIVNSRLLRWWVTPKLPNRHIEGPLESGDPWRVIVTFFVHPIKRRIARLYLRILKRLFGLRVIGITGSAGKTTTKEMLGSILKRVGKTVVTRANIDPVYNIPTTILKCRPNTEFLLLEMGVEFPGEVGFYLWLADLDVAIITNIYKTHTQFFGSENGVYNEKSQILSALDKDDFVVLNAESKYFNKLKRSTSARKVSFGSGSDFSYHDIKVVNGYRTQFNLKVGEEDVKVTIPVLGKQFVENAAAAAAAADCLGANLKDIKFGLESYVPVQHRMQVMDIKNGNIVVDDSYNNNPAAAIRAIDVLVNNFGSKKKILIFGEMLELGQNEEKEHLSIGKTIARKNVDYLVAVGFLAKFTYEEFRRIKGKDKAFWCKDYQCVLNTLLHKIKPENAVILIKGSHKLQLEYVSEALM